MEAPAAPESSRAGVPNGRRGTEGEARKWIVRGSLGGGLSITEHVETAVVELLKARRPFEHVDGAVRSDVLLTRMLTSLPFPCFATLEVRYIRRSEWQRCGYLVAGVNHIESCGIVMHHGEGAAKDEGICLAVEPKLDEVAPLLF